MWTSFNMNVRIHIQTAVVKHMGKISPMSLCVHIYIYIYVHAYIGTHECAKHLGNNF
jgi:hypothetical protein